MKRFLCAIAIMAIGICAVFAASGGAGKKVKWELKDGTLTFSGTGPMKNFGKDRPWRTDMVRAIVVCDGVTSLGNNVARDCDRLLTVELPSSLTSIGENAFLNCVNLSEIRLPYGVETIGKRAFANCKTFIEFELPISMRTVGEEAFAGCDNIIKGRINQSLESIGANAFKGCKLLAELIELPAFVTTTTFVEYGLSRSAIKNYWDKKDALAAKFGNASGSNNIEQVKVAEVVPSDVDLEIPFTGLTNDNTFAVIIANENYGKLANVPFALNDGNTMALYCHRTLGIPEKNILKYTDASYGAMREAFSDLRLINDVVGDQMKVIFYYAGHGAPDDATLEPYLIPVDAARVNAQVCVPLKSIYAELASMKLSSCTVFLDACFSGATRDDNMLASARGIARVPKAQSLGGNIAVLSATSDKQTALPYNEKSHGMFTYFLLKRLQETKGEVTLQDLKEYVSEQVARNSSIINRKDQNPTFTVSSGASSAWDQWKLNK